MARPFAFWSQHTQSCSSRAIAPLGRFFFPELGDWQPYFFGGRLGLAGTGWVVEQERCWLANKDGVCYWRVEAGGSMATYSWVLVRPIHSPGSCGLAVFDSTCRSGFKVQESQLFSARARSVSHYVEFVHSSCQHRIHRTGFLPHCALPESGEEETDESSGAPIDCNPEERELRRLRRRSARQRRRLLSGRDEGITEADAVFDEDFLSEVLDPEVSEIALEEVSSKLGADQLALQAELQRLQLQVNSRETDTHESSNGVASTPQQDQNAIESTEKELVELRSALDAKQNAMRAGLAKAEAEVSIQERIKQRKNALLEDVNQEIKTETNDRASHELTLRQLVEQQTR
mmetsp:Transcript_1458/g.3029  ORF Transcript_1458/g.3029 Transcript_1458/m.3029 type:complete len:346 (+) Transcript_1458:1851-2888(+)